MTTTSKAIILASALFDAKRVHICSLIVVRLWTQWAELDLKYITTVIEFKAILSQEILDSHWTLLLPLVIWVSIWTPLVAPLETVLLLGRTIAGRIVTVILLLFLKFTELLCIVSHLIPHIYAGRFRIAALFLLLFNHSLRFQFLSK